MEISEETSKEEKEREERLEFENLNWVFGMNKDISNGVHHLGDETRKEIFYVAGHIGVIYNFQKHEQRLLQGHTNPISCVCVSQDKRWIVTGDGGKENLIVVWDSHKGIPVKTFFNPHEDGTQSLSISSDGLFIASLSRAYIPGREESDNSETIGKNHQQDVSIWQWTSERDGPIYTSIIKGSADGKPQQVIRFHPTDVRLLVSNSSKRVVFWSWAESALKFYSPPLTKTEFQKPVGEFTQSAFIPGTSLAASGTRNGEVVLWQKVQNDPSAKMTDRRALKVVQVHKSSINFLDTVDGKYVVTGGADGFVRFFDYQLRLQAWFEEFDAGPINGVSFEKSSSVEEAGLAAKLEEEFDDELEDMERYGTKSEFTEKKFEAPNFVVSTSLALILHVESDSFNEYEVESIRGVLLVQGQEGPVQSLAVHPSKPYLAISGLSGHLHLWDYEKHQVLSLTMFQNLFITCIAFDPKGNYLAVGCTNGVIKILEVKKFEEIQSFQPSKLFIRKIEFSHNSKYFAFSDLGNCVGIFRWGYRDEDERKPIEWVYVGRCQAHKFGESIDEDKCRIADFQWGIAPGTSEDDNSGGGAARLISLGEDRRLVEYDLEESRITEGVQIKAVYKIGQNARPTAMLWTQTPNITVKYQKEPDEFDCLIVCNNHYKFMRYITPNFGRAPDCTKTFRCPTFGGPLTRLVQVNEELLAYSCDDKIVGLALLPLDGNPTKTMGCIAHSGEILDICCSNDGKYLFTAGGVDHTVNVWKVDSKYLKRLASSKLEEIETFKNLVEGGAEGEFFKEIKQYFFYAQIRSQGEVTTNERKISGEVPVAAIPSVLRVLGGVEADLGHSYGYQYFSDYQIKNLMNELRSILGYTLETSSDETELVDFDTFLKVFINHKPIYYTDVEDIRKSFGVMRREVDRKNNPDMKISKVESTRIPIKEFFNLLLTKGEKMTMEELEECVKIILGKNLDVEKLCEKKKMLTPEDFAKMFLYFEEE